jgi:hypothetical protein
MGFKLAGLAINENFKGNQSEVFRILNIGDYKFAGESRFHDAWRFFEDNEVGIGFFDKGTFVSAGTTLTTNIKLLKEASKARAILAFYMYDTTGTYCFDYYEAGKWVRSKWFSDSDANIDGSDNFGELLAGERDEGDEQTVIFNLISQMLGMSIWDIDRKESDPVLLFQR